MRGWLGAAAAAISVHAAAAPDLALDVRLDPATREFSAVAELRRAPRDYRFTPHPSLSVRRVERERSGTMRIEYGGTLPPLDRNIDFRGVLQALAPMAAPEGSFLGSASGCRSRTSSSPTEYALPWQEIRRASFPVAW
jgi:hypothetical protein